MPVNTRFIPSAKLQFSFGMPGRRLYIFFVLALVFASCKNSKEHDGQVFYWNMATGVTSMDPAFARVQSNIWVTNQIFEGLVGLDDSLHVVPAIAKRWTISPDGLAYIFYLRDGIYFQDNEAFSSGKGRKVTAADFAYSFNRIIDPKTASPGAWIFNGKVKMLADSVSGAFTAVNDSTFKIELTKPYRPFLQLLALKYASVVPHEAIEKYGKDFRAHPVGTGPFQLLYNYEGDKVVLEKNLHYYLREKGKQLPYLDRVVISFMPNKQNEFFSFLNGKLSILTGLDASFKDDLLEKNGDLKQKFKGKFQFRKIPYLNTEYLGILVDPKLNSSPLIEKTVRQAISYAIDREKMIRYLRNNIGIAGTQGFVPPSLLKDTAITDMEFIPSNIPQHISIVSEGHRKGYYNYDPAQARHLLNSIGYSTQKPLTGIRIVTTDQYLDMAVFVQKQLEDVGIMLQIDNVPPSSLSEMKAQGKAPFFRGSWIADYADPENYLSIFYSKNCPPNGPNYFYYRDPAFDRLYEASLAEQDEKKRNQMYCAMQDILMDDAPVIVLFYDVIVRLVDNRVEGLNSNAINLIDLKKVRFKDF